MIEVENKSLNYLYKIKHIIILNIFNNHIKNSLLHLMEFVICFY